MKKGTYLKRPFALILSFCMILTMLSGISFAVENGFPTESQDSGPPVYRSPRTSLLDSNLCLLDSSANLTVTKWEWVDPDGILTWDSALSAWTLGIPTGPDYPVDKWLVLDVLPKKIKAAMADGSEKEIGVAWDETQLDIIDGRAWNGSYTIHACLAEGLLGEGVPQPCFVLILDSPATMAVTEDQLESHIIRDAVDPANTTVNLFDYYIDEPTSPPTADVTKKDYNHTHSYDDETKMPNESWIKYWLPESKAHWALDPLSYDGYARNPISTDKEYNKNINENHLFLFGDTIGHAGLWNRGAGQNSPFGKKYAGMENIVKNTLVDDYPVINLQNARKELVDDIDIRDFRLIKYFNQSGDCSLIYNYNSSDGKYPNIANNVIGRWEAATGQQIDDTDAVESLNYLFDPEIEHDGKTAYTDVKGLFQLDDEGYYYYNIRKNFAEFVEEEDNNHFVLYDAPATIRTDGVNSIGNFFPFNKGTEVFAPALSDQTPLQDGGVGANADMINHYMGMTVDLTFRQPLNGELQMGALGLQPMTFQFSGDDDVWVFIDDVLVLDIGGVHSELYGTIDFATGEVLVGRAFTTNGIPTKEQIEEDIRNPDPTGGPRPVITTTLYDQFSAAGATNTTNWRTNEDGSITTFASNTTHTLRMFYLERGNYDSSLALRFNLQPLLYQQLRKVDQNGRSIEGVTFDLYRAREIKDPDLEAELKTWNTQQLQDGGYIACNNREGVTANKGEPYFVQILDGEKDPLTSIETGEDGTSNFIDINAPKLVDTEGKETQQPPFNFSDNYQVDPVTGEETGKYYVLKEREAPDGYRQPPIDIALEFDHERTMLTVANRWTTGAYASFVDNILGTSNFTYGHFDVIEDADKKLSPTIGNDPDKVVTAKDQREGLILVVPMLKNKNITATNHWNAVYGNNIDGYFTVETQSLTSTAPSDIAAAAADWRQTVLKAALYQAAYSVDNDNVPHWHLEWTPSEGRLTGYIRDFPGIASRYALTHDANDQDYDMRSVFGVITMEGFRDGLGINIANYPATPEKSSSAQLYEALGEKIMEIARKDGDLDRAVEQAANAILGVDDPETASGKAFSFLNLDQFNRSFRSLIYIPNEQRELRVRKIDQNNQPVPGARFAIFAEPECRNQVSETGVTDQNGDLIFAPYTHNTGKEDGLAEMVWVTNQDNSNYGTRYYLKELSAPKGYQLNPTIVPVVVGYYSIYADAGTPEDGVSVMAGVGKLNQTMTKYAQNPVLNITLRDIVAIAQSQPSGDGFGLHDWEDVYLKETQDVDVLRSMNLHYKLNEVVDYGLHDQDGGKVVEPFFTTDTGFLRARVIQNNKEGQNPYLDEDSKGQFGNWDDLGSTDLTNIFSLLNIVVITDQKDNTPQGSLRLSKRVTGQSLTGEDYTKNFLFRIDFTDKSGNRLPGEFHFYGTDKEGTIQSGESLPLHHDEEIVIRGLPYGTQYTITETTSPDFPYVTPPGGVVDGQITQEEPDKAQPFVNSKDPLAAFTIRKTVTGTNGETDRDFHFTVTLKDEKGADLPYRYPYSGSKTGGVRSGGTITLRHDQEVTIGALPIGAAYTVVEQDADQNGYTTTYTGTAGEGLTADRTPAAAFVNHRDGAAALTIRKTVTGSTGERDRDFHFTVTLRDKDGVELSGRYPFTGSKTGDVRSGETITLRHGQWVTIGDLPLGASYTVTEQEADGDGYTTSSTGAAGEGLALGDNPQASFVNHRGGGGGDDDGDDDPPPPVPEGPGEPSNPRTGDITATGGWILLSLAFLAGIAGILYDRWRKKKGRS
ncbi:MAG: fibro-slime domain-containing protein [Angelakisella sp.]|jgi:hypothetical protein|nr:fibro-slime domain-containing protein [Angelakisella sp.]